MLDISRHGDIPTTFQTDFDRVCARLSEVWQEFREKSMENGYYDSWKTCKDINLVFSTATPDGALEIFIGDMYASMNVALLREKEVGIVVNMMGQADVVDDRNAFWGQQWHWSNDKDLYKEAFSGAEANGLTLKYQRCVEEEYMPDQHGFYDKLGV